MAVNYSILADVELNTKDIQKKLNDATKNAKLNLDTKDAKSGIDSLGDSMEDTSLTFQAANEVFSRTIDVITSMASQVFELDSAITELKKVTDLSGDSLEEYVSKLAEMGSTVARTGEPKRRPRMMG